MYWVLEQLKTVFSAQLLRLQDPENKFVLSPVSGAPVHKAVCYITHADEDFRITVERV